MDESSEGPTQKVFAPIGLPKNIHPVPSCPSDVVRLLSVAFEHEDWQSSSYSQLLIRCCCDMEMELVWAALAKQTLPDPDICAVLMSVTGRALRLTDADYAFAKKTDAERLRWVEAVRSASARLQSLLREGPGLIAENVLASTSIDQMRWFLRVLGVQVVPSEAPLTGYDRESNKWLVSEWELQRAQRGTYTISLDDMLDKLIAETSAGVPSTQSVKKPRDAKSYRAFYILQITEDIERIGYHLTDEQVAIIARVVLQDEAMTPALANRFRYRDFRDVCIGALIQDSSESSENLG